MNDSYPGLWYIMPPALLQEAIQHGHYRQSRALTRKAKYRWPGTVAQLTAYHVEEATLEAAAAHCLGVPWPKRVDTDHSKPRLDIPGTGGVWVRVCKKWQNPAKLKVRPDDYGIVISGRLHEEAIQDVPIMLVEVRAFAWVEDITANYQRENPGNRKSASGEDADCYLVPWRMPHIYPIEDLVKGARLKVPADVLRGGLTSVSDLIDYAPQQRENPSMDDWLECPVCTYPNFPVRTTCFHCARSLAGARLNSRHAPKKVTGVKCEDGCPDRTPRSVGGFVCNVCGFYLFH